MSKCYCWCCKVKPMHAFSNSSSWVLVANAAILIVRVHEHVYASEFLWFVPNSDPFNLLLERWCFFLSHSRYKTQIIFMRLILRRHLWCFTKILIQRVIARRTQRNRLKMATMVFFATAMHERDSVDMANCYYFENDLTVANDSWPGKSFTEKRCKHWRMETWGKTDRGACWRKESKV